MKDTCLRGFFQTCLLSAVIAIGIATPASLADDANTVSSFVVTKKGSTLHVTAGTDSVSWANTQLLIDTDGDAKTGYHAAGFTNGFDVMVEGTTVYRFKGDDPAAWNWEKIGVATRTLDQEALTLDMPMDGLPSHSHTATVVLRSACRLITKR